jgi:hypothetical protein
MAQEERGEQHDDHESAKNEHAPGAHRGAHLTWKPRQKTSAGSMKIVL